MAVNRLHYIYKLSSSWLKENKYNVNLTFDEALSAQKMCTLSSNVVIRIINQLVGREFTKDGLESLFEQKKKISHMKNNKENRNKLKYIQKYIYELLAVPELCILSVDNNSEYDKINKDGFKINGRKYTRLSCSAGNARQKKVVFCDEEIAKQIIPILDNGRDVNKKFIPSKYSAYMGLYTSASKVVTFPRMAVIPDASRKSMVSMYWVDEQEEDKDDIITFQSKEQEFNDFDGQGLISPTMARQWQEDLDLDYLPSTFIIRGSFIKGQCVVFDYVEWCKEYNNGNYMVDTIYKGDNGKPKQVDVREVDVILTESQFKLHDCYPSFEYYLECTKKNNLTFGVAGVNAKQNKDILALNYQFIQTLNLSKDDIVDLCKMTKDYFRGVTTENIYYTLLFMLGTGINNDKIKDFIKQSDNYMLKSLLVNPKLIDDKYIRQKIYDNIESKISQSCMGKIYVRGNFQQMISDPFAMCEHMVGKEVVGLLNAGECFSKYWADKDVKKILCMRSPLTGRSEDVLLNVKKNKLIEKWYKYIECGFVLNTHDDSVLRFAGSDKPYCRFAE